MWVVGAFGWWSVPPLVLKMNLKRKKSRGRGRNKHHRFCLSFFFSASCQLGRDGVEPLCSPPPRPAVIAGVYPESSASEQPAHTVVAGKSIQMAISACGGCRCVLRTWENLQAMAPETVTIQTGPEIDLTVDARFAANSERSYRREGKRTMSWNPAGQAMPMLGLVGPWTGIPGRERFTHCVARSLAAFAGPGPLEWSSVCSRLRRHSTADFRVRAPLSVAWTRSPSQSTTNSGDRW